MCANAMGKTRCVLLLLLVVSIVAFLNVSLRLYLNNQRRLRHDVPLNRLEQAMAGNADKQTPLLLLFTCFTREQGKAYIQTNTLRNWALFRPMVQPLLFTDYDDGPLVEFAKKLGWYVMPVPNKSKIGVPFLKNMYWTAMKTHKSMLYGYSNGDILFTDGFVQTLNEVVIQSNALNTTMIIGRRTNYNINFTSWSPIYQLGDVEKLSKKGSLFATNAEDYFFVTDNFPWHLIPDLVIGRRAYDNFLVGFAIKQNISVIDATRTVVALHQTGIDGNWAGHKHRDGNFNADVIKKTFGKFSYDAGVTSLAQYETAKDYIGNVFIKTRPPVPKSATKRKH